MSQFPIEPLNYSSPLGRPPPPAGPPGHGVRLFFLGLGAGTLVSLVAWGLGWRYVERGPAEVLVWLIPVAGVTLLCLRGRRLLGAGILCSIAIGFLIFFVQCAANLRL